MATVLLLSLALLNSLTSCIAFSDPVISTACGLREMPVMVQNTDDMSPHIPTNSPPFFIICQRSNCLNQARNITCVKRATPCESENEWLRGWSRQAPFGTTEPVFTCCRSPNVLRSSLIRTAPIVPGHTGLMRGFEEILHPANVYFQFGEAVTNIQLKSQGVLLLGVSRFKCGQDVSGIDGNVYDYLYSDEQNSPLTAAQQDAQPSRRRKRKASYASLIEPLDKPACDSEWESTETISSLSPSREGRSRSAGGTVLKVTDVNYCGVQVTKSEEVTMTF